MSFELNPLREPVYVLNILSYVVFRFLTRLSLLNSVQSWVLNRIFIALVGLCLNVETFL